MHWPECNVDFCHQTNDAIYFTRVSGFVLPTGFWLGAYSLNTSGSLTHYWQSCGVYREFDWTEWDAGEPDGPGTDNCVRIHTNWQMRSMTCGSPYDVLCQQKGITYNCIYVISLFSI